MGLKNREPVEFFVDGRNAWQTGVLGFFTRKRGILASAILTFIFTTSSPWWWPKNLTTIEFNISPGWLAVGLLIFFASFFIVGLIYLRYRSIRSLEIKYILHQLEHYLRDHQTEMFELKFSDNITSYEVFKERFTRYLSEILNQYREYFRKLIGNNTIELAVRLAIDISDNDSEPRIVYRTMARTSGLNSGREKTTEDLPPNEGIARFLNKQDCRGILLYNDIDAAIRLKAFKKTNSERQYPEDIITMMVAPLNGWGGENKNMIGILYITSRNRKTFSVKYTDSALFAADMFSRSLVNTIELFSEHKKRIGRH